MVEINLLRINLNGDDFILLDDETNEMSNLETLSGYKRLGRYKDIDWINTNINLEKKLFVDVNLYAYKNYFIIDGDDVYGKEWICSNEISFITLLVSKKIIIRELVTPEFLNEHKDNMEILMNNPVFYMK